MLRTVPADHIDLCPKALAVHYKDDPSHPGLLLVSIIAHQTDGGPDYIWRTETGLITVAECMTKSAMQERVTAEATRREIENVAWIEER